MKPKNQLPPTSENDAKEKLIIYVYEYLINSGAENAANTFLKEINYVGEILRNPDDRTGFLAGWWFVFWDLYCAAADKKPGQPEPSTEARAFHDFSRGAAPGMSPSCAPNTSPPGPPGFMPGGPGPMMGGVRYGAPHSNHPMRPGPMNGPGPRMQNMMPQGGPPPPPPQMVGGPPAQPPHSGPPMMGSPRYGPHPGHMTPGSSSSTVPMGGPDPGPSPGVNRMTPNHTGSPHPQQVGPPNGMPPMSGQMGGPHGGPPPQMGSSGGPIQGMQPRNGQPPHNWQGNFSVNSPVDQQFMMSGPPVSSSQQGDFGTMMMGDGGMMEVKGTNNNGPPNQPQDEYVMPGPYGQQTDQGEDGAQILKLKESLENNTNNDYKDTDPTSYNSMEYQEPKNW